MLQNEFKLSLKQAYIAHIKWRSAAQAMHVGVSLYEKDLVTNASKTKFGLWLLNNKEILTEYKVYKDLDTLNNRIHYIYNNILKTEKEKKSSTLSKWLKIASGDDSDERIIELFKELMHQSKKMLQILKKLETENNLS
jgi:hypothetical protein